MIENLSKYGEEITQCSSEPKSHIASPSSQSIVSEVSHFVEEKSKIYSLVQRHIHPKTSTFTEEELEKVLEIAPFLDKTLLTKEDIGYILQVFQKNLDYFSSLQSRQDPVVFPPYFTVGSSSSFSSREGLFESASFQFEEILNPNQPFEDFKDLVNSQSQTSSPKISTNIQSPGQVS